MCPAADGSVDHGTVWADLYELGAHFVLSKRYPFSGQEQARLAQLADDPQRLKARWAKLKKPRKWRETPASAEAAHEHVKKGGLVGVVPSSLSCVVLDLDGGGTDAALQVMQTLSMLLPVANMPSRRDDGRHLWFLLTDAEETSNRTEHPAFAPLKVDVRGSNGFVWCWQGDAGAEQLLKGINGPIDVVERERWDALIDPPKPKTPAPSPPALEPDEVPRHARFLDKVIEARGGRSSRSPKEAVGTRPSSLPPPNVHGTRQDVAGQSPRPRSSSGCEARHSLPDCATTRN